MNSQQMIAKNHIHQAIREVLAAQKEWLASGKPTVQWGPVGAKVQVMSVEFENFLDSLCLISNETNVEDAAKEAVLAIDRVQKELEAWRHAMAVAPNSVSPGGTPELFTAIRLLEEPLAEKPKRLPEPIRELMDSGVSDEQICKIYGFLTDSGDPDMIKLNEEKHESGKHYNPKTWQPPGAARRQREINAIWDARRPASHTPMTERATPRTESPETIDQLIMLGVDAEQIALMKNKPLHEVEEYVRQWQAPVEGRTPEIPPEMEEDAQKALAAKRNQLHPKSHPEIEDLKERILACAVDNLSIQDTTIALQKEWPDLNWLSVKEVYEEMGQTVPNA